MIKRKRSVASYKPSKTRSARAGHKNTLGDQIIQGLEEGLAYARGEMKLRTRTIRVPDDVDVRQIREQSGLSQSEFAGRYGFSLRTLQEWEQGRAKPDSAVRAYMTVIARNRNAVEEALAR